MTFVKKIQEKPRSTRVLILWTSVVLVMIVIIAIWLFSFSKGLSYRKTGEEIEKTKLPSLFENIKKDFNSIKQMFNASLKSINLEENEGEGQ